MFTLYDSKGRIDATRTDTAVTVGVFDGVHRGHQALLRSLGGSGLAPLVVTLTSHPSFVLGRRSSEYWLDDETEHIRLLFEGGAQYVAVLPFTREVARLTACGMADLLYDTLRMRALLIGYDSRFGSKTDDDFGRLPLLAAERGFTILHGEPYTVDGEPISSSRIRESLADGNVEETCTLLGRRYSVTGTVLHGRGVGHTLGFPTANISLADTRKMLPKEGVYAVRVLADVGTTPTVMAGMANLGTAPTFSIDKPVLEVHLLGFDGDLYGQTVEVQFCHRLRDIVRFGSAEALQQQLKEDLEQVRLWT